jgi:hypothetical protein
MLKFQHSIESSFKNKLVWWNTTVIPATWEAEEGGSQSKGRPMSLSEKKLKLKGWGYGSRGRELV